MILKKIGSRVFITNLFADFILSKISNEEQSIINVVDCKNFYIIKGQTTSKEVLDLTTITSEFSQKFESLIGNTKMSHTIDLIDYDSKLPDVSNLTQTYHFSENCSYSEGQINLFNQENESYKIDFICKKITDDELVNYSEFPHGYSLGQGRLLYYYGKHLFYSVPQTYPYIPLTFKLTTSKDEDGQEIVEINIFKYEMIKMLIDRVINEIDDYEEEELDIFRKDKVGTPSFRLAFNTLIKNDIIIEENE
jgi:hypothetical protein